MPKTTGKNATATTDILRKNRLLWMCALTSAVGYTFASVEIKILSGLLVDTLTEHGAVGGLFRSVVLWLLLLLALGYGKDYFCNRYTAAFAGNAYRAIVHHTGRQKDAGAGDSGGAATYMTQDIDAVTKCLTRIFKILIPDAALFALAMFTIGSSASWLLALAVFSLCAIQILVTWMVNRRLKQHRRLLHQELEKSNRTALLGMDNMEAAKVYGIEETVAENYRRSFDQYNAVHKRITRITSALSAYSLFFTFLTMFLITAVSGKLVYDGQMTLGAFFVALSMIDSILSPVMRFENSIKIIFDAKTNVERIGRYLHTPEESAPSEPLAAAENRIACRDVTFSYDPSRKVLEHISFACVPGRCHVILGPNGCGKTTLVRLLLGELTPASGCISIMGRQVEQLSPAVLREKIAVLPQETVILPATVYENLTLGHNRISKEAVRQLCRAVGIHEEIEQLPQQYETLLQDYGEPLSGGQKKRIAIVRTLLRDVPVYILDEPSASLDYDHVILLKQVLHRLSQEKIVIVITHDSNLITPDSHIIRLEGAQYENSF